MPDKHLSVVYLQKKKGYNEYYFSCLVLNSGDCTASTYNGDTCPKFLSTFLCSNMTYASELEIQVKICSYRFFSNPGRGMHVYGDPVHGMTLKAFRTQKFLVRCYHKL